MVVLREEIVLRKARVHSLEDVKSLQCWGLQLNKVDVLARLPNLEVLNLSCNELSSLADLRHCAKLRHLFLRKNRITSLEEIKHLQQLPHLQVLWLSGNPITSQSDYRLQVLQLLPNLQQLDKTKISDSERALALQLHTKMQCQEHLLKAVTALLPLMDGSSLAAVQELIWQRLPLSPGGSSTQHNQDQPS